MSSISNVFVNSSSPMSLFIPRVYPSITEERIRWIIEYQTPLGVVDRIDIVKVEGKTYNRVFIHFKEWYDTEFANRFQSSVRNPNEDSRIIYDVPWYWIILENTSVKTQLNVVVPSTPKVALLSEANREILNRRLHKAPFQNPPAQLRKVFNTKEHPVKSWNGKELSPLFFGSNDDDKLLGEIIMEEEYETERQINALMEEEMHWDDEFERQIGEYYEENKLNDEDYSRIDQFYEEEDEMFLQLLEDEERLYARVGFNDTYLIGGEWVHRSELEKIISDYEIAMEHVIQTCHANMAMGPIY